MEAINIGRGTPALRRWLNYIHREMLDFEKMEADNMLQDYYDGMRHLMQYNNKNQYVPFYKYHAELLLLLSANPGASTSEIASMRSTSVAAISRQMGIMIGQGYVYSYKEKASGPSLYRLTPYGQKHINEVVEDPESILYTDD